MQVCGCAVHQRGPVRSTGGVVLDGFDDRCVGTVMAGHKVAPDLGISNGYAWRSRSLMSIDNLGNGDAGPRPVRASATPRYAAAPLHQRLRPHPSSVGLARRLVGQFLKDAGSEALLEPAQLLTSELVTNALMHGTGAIDLTLLTLDDHLRVEVADRGRHRPQPHPHDLMADTGRGLKMVDQLSESWGVLPTVEGKAVWFQLRPGPAAATRATRTQPPSDNKRPYQSPQQDGDAERRGKGHGARGGSA